MFEGLQNLVTRGSKAKTPATEPKTAEPKAEPIAEPAVVFLPAEPAVVEQAPSVEQAPAPVDDDDRRPVVETEERDEHIPARTPGRIRFLLETFESGRMDRTEARIHNDQMRIYFSRSNEPSLRRL